MLRSSDEQHIARDSESSDSSPPQMSIGLLLKNKRVTRGWSLEDASRRSGIPDQALHAIEEMRLNLFINQGAKLEHQIRMYANRLGQSLIGHEALIDKAKQMIRPKALTEDQLGIIRGSR